MVIQCQSLMLIVVIDVVDKKRVAVYKFLEINYNS